MKFLVSILLLASSFAAAGIPDDKPGKEAIDAWANQYVSLHNSSITVKELAKRLKIWNAAEIVLYGQDELSIKIPKVSYDSKKSEFKFANGMSLVIKDALTRKFVIDGKDYVLPEDMLKFYSDKKPTSKLTGCQPREKASHLQHAMLIPFATAAAFLNSQTPDISAVPACGAQVSALRGKLKAAKLSLVSLSCDPQGMRLSMDVQSGSGVTNVSYNTWAATYDVGFEKDKVTFLPNGKMRMGAKLCAADFDKYQRLRNLIEPVEPLVRDMMVGRFCRECGTPEWTNKLTAR